MGLHLRSCLETRRNVFFTQENSFQEKGSVVMFCIVFEHYSCSTAKDKVHRLNPIGLEGLCCEAVGVCSNTFHLSL